MTVSTHVYRAFVVGTPDVELELLGGSITLDSGRAPHVTGSIEVVANETILDPRLTQRIRVDVAASFAFTSQARSFDLIMRDRDVSQSDATVSLSLASDESLLEDFAPIAEDDTPFDIAASLRDVIDYVLDTAIPGAALEASPSVDADVTAYWSITNMLMNPGAEGSVAPWESAGNCTLFHSTAFRTGAHSCGFTSVAAGNLAVTPMALSGKTSVTAGKSYVLSGYGRRFGATARTIEAVIRWVDADGATPWLDVTAPAVALTDTSWERTVAIGIAPDGAVAAFMFFRVIGSSAAGEIGYIDDAMFYEGDRVVDFFDGASTGGGYTYAFSNVANASTSTRTPDVERPPEALTWKSGQTAIDFLAPLVQAAGFRLVCDEQRNWTLRDESFTASGSMSIRYGVNMIDGSDRIARDSGLWYDAAVTIYQWTDADGIARERRDAYALTMPYTRLRTFERDTPYPGPGFSEYAVRRAQGRGREVTATAVSDWTAQAEQPITIVLENAPTQIGATQSIRYDLTSDRMTVNTRTTDTPEGAIDLLVGTIDSLVGTIDSL